MFSSLFNRRGSETAVRVGIDCDGSCYFTCQRRNKKDCPLRGRDGLCNTTHFVPGVDVRSLSLQAGVLDIVDIQGNHGSFRVDLLNCLRGN